MIFFIQFIIIQLASFWMGDDLCLSFVDRHRKPDKTFEISAGNAEFQPLSDK